jgi:RNA polymerase sigma-70 factor (ECF subfamily)
MSVASTDFERLMEAHRAELHAHCYRMLGSVHDADDALQEALVRAWRGVQGLRNPAAARGWLYSIATNVCLTELERRKRRGLPHDFGPAADAETPPGMPLAESVWIEPYPYGPEDALDQREGIELAFVAALQHLPPSQRAVLILREVLGFSAQETAGLLDTSLSSVTSALQRAREGVRKRVPEQTQQANLQALGDDGLRELVERWIGAWESNDVTSMTSMLAQDATFAMPPLSTWYTPRAVIAGWARASSMSGAWRWKGLLTWANAQPAIAFYTWDDASATHLPFALNVLSLDPAGRVSDVTAFIARSIESPDPEAYRKFPAQPMDDRRVAGTFARFGLPASV